MANHPTQEELLTVELKVLIEKIRSENVALKKLIENLNEQNINGIKPKY